MSYITSGDRIRLVKAEATVEDGNGRTLTAPLTLRHSWTEHSPEHICCTDTCVECLTLANRIVVRGLERAGKVARDSARVVALRALSDGQAKAR